jgi:hypothetical protein
LNQFVDQCNQPLQLSESQLASVAPIWAAMSRSNKCSAHGSLRGGEVQKDWAENTKFANNRTLTNMVSLLILIADSIPKLYSFSSIWWLGFIVDDEHSSQKANALTGII